MMKRRIVFLATIAATLLMAFGGVTAQAAGIDRAASAQQADQEPGLVIVSVDSDGPAAAAGIKRGDILLEIDGQQTDRARDVLQVLSSLKPDDEIQVRVLHGDDERTLDVTVGDRNGKPYLGMQPYFGGESLLLPDVATVEAATPGALIFEVVAESPAADAGLEAGDIITAVDGKALDDSADLASAIGQYQPSDEITLAVVKPNANGASTDVVVTLGENPDQPDKPLLGVRYHSATESFRQLDPGQDEELTPLPFPRGQMPFVMPASATGAVVLSVAADSPAESAGLLAGDVVTEIDGAAVAKPQDLVDAVGAKKPGDSVTLTVERAGEDTSLSVDVTLGENPDKQDKAYLGVSIGAVRMRLQRDGQGQDSSPFGFRLPFSLDDLPFDLDKLPLPFQFEQQAPSGQEPA
jgi:S1-C subfamily serine protease